MISRRQVLAATAAFTTKPQAVLAAAGDGP